MEKILHPVISFIGPQDAGFFKRTKVPQHWCVPRILAKSESPFHPDVDALCPEVGVLSGESGQRQSAGLR
jgi:hypothetical protein